VLDLLEMVIAESGKKRRNEKTVTAYAYMIGQALEFTRYGIEAGHTNAAELAESVRKRLLALGEGRAGRASATVADPEPVCDG
jgi:hypothetical protein